MHQVLSSNTLQLVASQFLRSAPSVTHGRGASQKRRIPYFRPAWQHSLRYTCFFRLPCSPTVSIPQQPQMESQTFQLRSVIGASASRSVVPSMSEQLASPLRRRSSRNALSPILATVDHRRVVRSTGSASESNRRPVLPSAGPTLAKDVRYVCDHISFMKRGSHSYGNAHRTRSRDTAVCPTRSIIEEPRATVSA